MPKVWGFKWVNDLMMAGGVGLRLLIRILLLIPIVLIIIVCSVYYFNRPAKPPSIQEAPWMIQTESRVFYASKCAVNDGNPVIDGYWYLDSKKYRHVEDTIYFDKAYWGRVIVVRRSR